MFEESFVPLTLMAPRASEIDHLQNLTHTAIDFAWLLTATALLGYASPAAL